MRKDTNEVTQTTNYEEKRILGQARGMSVLYINVFLSSLNKYFSSSLQSSFSSLFWGSPLIRIFIFLLYLHRDYLSPTPRRLRLHSQDFCLIRNILATTVHGHFLINAAKGVIVLHLMQMGQLLHPSPFISLVTRAESTFFPL